jgi:hypothetical protein
MSESMGGIISECPGDFIGIGTLEATGYPAASDVLSAITDEMEEIFYRMADLEASSLEGLRSLAIAHVCLSEAGKIEAVGSLDDMMIGKLLSSLTGMPVSVPAV